MRGFLPRPALPRTAGYRLALVCACIGYYFRCPAYQFRHLRYDLPGLHGHPDPFDWYSMGYGDPRSRVPVDRGSIYPREQETAAHVAIATRGTYNRRNIAPTHNQTSVGTRCGVRMGGGLVLVLAGHTSRHGGQAPGPHIHLHRLLSLRTIWTSVGTRCGVRMGGGLVLVLAGHTRRYGGQAPGPHIHPTPPLVPTYDGESE